MSHGGTLTQEMVKRSLINESQLKEMCSYYMVQRNWQQGNSLNWEWEKQRSIFWKYDLKNENMIDALASIRVC